MLVTLGEKTKQKVFERLEMGALTNLNFKFYMKRESALQ
jgi:hypothetical protein